MDTILVAAGLTSTGVTLIGDSTGSASMQVDLGGIAQQTTAGADGFIYITSGGMTSGTVVSQGGYESTREGARASGTVVSNGGYEWVDGVTVGVVVKNGGFEVLRRLDGAQSGGVSIGTVLSDGGTEIVSSGGVASNTVIEGGGTLQLQAGGMASGAITFGAGPGTLEIDDTTMPAATISGFASGDTIDLYGIGMNGVVTNRDTLTNQVTVSGSKGSITLQFAAGQALNFATTPDGFGGTDLVPCYCRGTLILTPTGEVPVEELAMGDRVVTLAGGEGRVHWVGRRAFDGRFIAGKREVLPIRVAAGALAEGVPVRDLWVSPGHSLYVDGVLVPAEHLINGATIVQEVSVELLEYFHVELDEHAILFADGAPAESYVDCDNRRMFSNGAEYERFYPDDERPRWTFCAPRLEWNSPELTVIRAALLERAAAQGHALDIDPDLHLIVDGAVVRPETIAGSCYQFQIPTASAAVSLASRSAVPAEVGAVSRDIRRLGVPVERVVLGDANLSLEVWHGHTALCDGFHEDEATHRWTDGLAQLPDSWLRPFTGQVVIEVHLASCGLPYRLDPPATSAGSYRPVDAASAG